MGRRQGSGEARKRESSSTESQRSHSKSVQQVAEVSFPGTVPRFEIPGWRARYGVVAGITGRGTESGRGFDLGLWSSEPVGEVMNRWLALRRDLNEFGAVVLGNQVHGTAVKTVAETEGWVQIQGIDGWVTVTPGVLLTVTIADCIPVYLVAPGRGVALLHAGWRGTAGGILGRGIECLLAATEVASSELIMHCGVGICGRCYEVGSEVMQGCGMAADGPGPWHLDLRDRLVEQAVGAGLRSASVSAWCSAHDADHFYSHRRSGGRDGRMLAYVGLLGKRSGASSA
jgi:purine-nucleoside/S-methyl-5'-thioadenosine phosphorylase / adenosine deaminase